MALNMELAELSSYWSNHSYLPLHVCSCVQCLYIVRIINYDWLAS